MTTQSFTRDEITTSDIPTGRLMALALTLPTVPGRSELFGRDHAFYAIASDQVSAIEWVFRTDPGTHRIMAARALALAGHTLAGIRALAPAALPDLTAAEMRAADDAQLARIESSACDR